jgi:Holliday junction resolvasome RuvABC endonuclease subunit
MLPYDPVGLDLSLTSTGVAIGEDTHAIRPGDRRGPERLAFIRSCIRDHLWIRLYEADGPTVVLLEGYSFASKNSHAHALGELGGVMRLFFHEHRIPVIEVPPTCRAKFATGKGNASKSEVVSAISARTGRLWLGPGNEDRCDAWILQEMGRSYFGEPRHNWPSTHLDALNKIDWSPIAPVESTSEQE